MKIKIVKTVDRHIYEGDIHEDFVDSYCLELIRCGLAIDMAEKKVQKPKPAKQKKTV